MGAVAETDLASAGVRIICAEAVVSPYVICPMMRSGRLSPSPVMSITIAVLTDGLALR